MEPDDNLRIREKLQDWEATPYALDKDRLWENYMPFPKARSGRRIAVYYAAASLALAAAIFYYTISEKEQLMAEMRIQELELALMEAKSTSAQREAMLVTIPCPERPTDPPIRRNSPRRITKAALRPSSVAMVQTESPAPDPAPIAKAEDHPLEELVTPAPEVSAVPSTPRIILGRTGGEATTQTSSGRLRLSLFRNDEVRDGRQATPPPVVVLAGINN